MRLPPVILASQSPRRQQLLRTVLRRFEVDVSHADEIAPSWLTPGETAQANAWLKARAVAARHPKALVIGSDTVVALGRRSFGKPADLAQAFGNLKTLSGKTHQVITGVALIQWNTRRCLLQAESTDVRFQTLSAEVIRTYLARIQPLDKAGGYAIQEHAELILSELKGSFTNVVGLPVERLRNMLAEWQHIEPA